MKGLVEPHADSVELLESAETCMHGEHHWVHCMSACLA